MGIADPHELAVFPLRVQGLQRADLAQLASIERHCLDAQGRHRLGTERRLPEIQPEALHTRHLGRLHGRGHWREAGALVVMDLQ